MKRELENMSVSKDSTALSTIADGRASLSSTFLDFCVKVRNNDPSILPELGNGKPFNIRHLSEKEDIELADALLENTNVTYLEFETEKYTNSSAEAMAKYVRTSKRLQHIRWNGAWYPQFRHCEEILCCFLPAIQESTSLRELHINFPLIGGPSNLALENMLTHTQSLRSLSLICPFGPLEDVAVAAARSGLKNNSTLQELTLEFSRGTTIAPILSSVRDHPLLHRLCLHGYAVDLTGLETVLLSETSNITELDIHRFYRGPRIVGLTPVLEALGRRQSLTKLGLHYCRLGPDEARLLRMAFYNTRSLQSLDLASNDLGSAELAELAPALYHDTSIEQLDLSGNNLIDVESAEILGGVLRSNKSITSLDLSGNTFGRTPGAIDCIASGLGDNSTLLKIDLSSCALGDEDVSILAQALDSRITTLQKLALGWNTIISTGIGVLAETMKQSHPIKDLDLQRNYFGDGGAILLARSLGKNVLPDLTRLSLHNCGIGDDGFIALMSALEHNTSLLHLDLRIENGSSERAFLALAESLPEIEVLQRLELSWCPGLVSAMPLLLQGLHKNTSLFRIHVAGCAPSLVPPTLYETAKCAGGWMQEMERVGYRNRFLPMIRASKERLPPLCVWPHALARVATHPDVIFEVLCSKPNLVPSKGTDGKEAAKESDIPWEGKRGDE
jgi:Ran GTPase-activating protein (RanGAP) involved in mRNA processing and transport